MRRALLARCGNQAMSTTKIIIAVIIICIVVGLMLAILWTERDEDE
jgi:hypothetical protein